MCVIAAVKLPRDPQTGQPTEDAEWCMFKIRDRVYKPNYKIRTYTKGSGTSLFCVDDVTDWAEGVRVKRNGSHNVQLMTVNSALNNTVDKMSSSSLCLANGKVSRRVISECTYKNAIKEFIDTGFDGCTLVSDGTNCTLLEQSVTPEALSKMVGDDTYELQSQDFIRSSVKVEDYMIVRTNHGENTKSGYSKKDQANYESSLNRKEAVEKYIEENVFTVDDLYDMIRYFYDLAEEADNPYNNPIRRRDVIDWRHHKVKVFTTSAFIMYKNKVQIFLIEADIRHKSLTVLNRDCFKVCVERL